MKKVLAALLALVLFAVCSGCSKAPETDSAEKKEQVAPSAVPAAAATEPAPTPEVIDPGEYELLKYKYDLLKDAHDQLLAKETVPKSDYDKLEQDYSELKKKLLELKFSAENEAFDSAAYNALKQKLENAEKSAERLRKTVLELRKEKRELQSRVKELEGRVEELEKQLGIDPESSESPGE